MATPDFRAISETTVDSKRRISLGKAGALESARYLVSVSDDGEILLTPLANVPLRERYLWERPALRESLQRGIRQAAGGEFHDLGDFTRFAEDA